ncbi:MAG: manganese catalase family protein [Thermanaeromonas sp.]|uniref:manganese catalase family protein n=1 Tax=Thermanaeromonas sp. TaxID=2003697 RepID=UPI00244019CB|nr:manganese catalase family protein [Thermanaeromonas sp.]MCG0278866.1 manganese catalase family protein [Thermanaeromonas sp.]
MWIYEKKLQYPVRVSRPNPRLAKNIITQYGGPDGELGASLRYLTQRYTMPIPQAKAVLTDIGTEELAHMEIIAALVYNLIKDAPLEEIKRAGLDGYYADHDRALYFVNPEGAPWTASYIQSKGDPIADLYENLAAEQKARATYELLINLSDDPDVTDVLRFLREREVVHFQRFGETLNLVYEYMERKKYY